MAERLHDWQVPPQASDDRRKLGWIDEATEDGQAWLGSQRGTYDWKKALDVISGRMLKQVPEYRSQVNTNHLKRNIREIVGVLSKIRPIGSYSSDNPAYLPNCGMMNKLTRALYQQQFFDRAIKDALYWAATTCTGWIWPVYSRGMAGRDRGAITLRALGAPCVLPNQLPSSGNFQQAYAVHILDEMPVYMAHGLFPRYAQWLKPTSSTYWHSADIRSSARSSWFSPSRIFEGIKSAAGGPKSMMEVMVPMRYSYIIDLALNETGRMIPMGEPDTPWYYEVPAIGQDIPVPGGGSRAATANDARLYPFRRLIISSESCIPYDGPSFDWHGMLPLAQFTLDRPPWEPLGYSIVRDGYDIQLTIQELERGIADRLVAQNDLPLAYDINVVSKREAQALDPMQPRARTGYDASGGTMPFQPAVPLEVYAVKPEQFTALEHFKTAMDEQHAIKDVMALAKARLAGDDIEKIMEANGPIISDMSRSMEAPVQQIGEMMKYLILEYLPVTRIVQYVGTEGVSQSILDTEPDSLVPSHLPGEGTESPSKASDGHRAHVLADNLCFTITPNSLHEYQQMEMKLGLIQLRKAMVPVDSQTIAESWNLTNFGTIPGNTMYQKWQNEQEYQLLMAARLKAVTEGLAAMGPVLGGLMAATPPGGVGPGNPVPEGRPSSGQQAPSLKVKAGENRSTITESAGGGRPV